MDFINAFDNTHFDYKLQKNITSYSRFWYSEREPEEFIVGYDYYGRMDAYGNDYSGWGSREDENKKRKNTVR